jgi:hypothetical protein
MELHKDLEWQCTEADLRRTEMVLQNQLEIAKLFANRQKRKARSPSLSESECGEESSCKLCFANFKFFLLVFCSVIFYRTISMSLGCMDLILVQTSQKF